MTITERSTATQHGPMSPLRKTALVAGVFYLITFVSIPKGLPALPHHHRRNHRAHPVRRP